MHAAATLAPSSRLTAAVTRHPRNLPAMTPMGKRFFRWGWRVRNFFRQRWRELPLEAALGVCRLHRHVVPGLNLPLHGRLYATIHRANGDTINLGHVGVHLVTNAGKGFVVDAWQNLVEMETMKYHGVGTGTTAAAAGDTALQTECTTALNPDSTRATGTTTEASAMVFRSVATVTFDAAAAVTEWGLFTQAATGGGTIFDRQVFSALNMVSGDSIQFTYDCTVA